ncbi:uncharacterized protein LOC103998647 [Musa acuminata AAA Group]|uniref:uncharacterized protein LOC103998647 n=1 Tax=Musa acuminata AAA Group TaxID=214697 RepID=UPI0031DC520A
MACTVEGKGGAWRKKKRRGHTPLSHSMQVGVKRRKKGRQEKSKIPKALFSVRGSPKVTEYSHRPYPPPPPAATSSELSIDPRPSSYLLPNRLFHAPFSLLYKSAPCFPSVSPPLFTSLWLAMEKLPASQVAKGAFLLALLLFTPFISSSLRTSYLYFLLNILIVALGLEAGFLTAISRPHEEKKAQNSLETPVPVEAAVHDAATDATKLVSPQERVTQAAKPPRKPAVQTRAQTLKRCPSRPSLFFIGGAEGDSFVKEEKEEKVEEAGELSKQELFAKAEAFIGNFYKQLRMQREESWKKIHGFYHRAF